jgi:hypothetical protein
MIKFKTPRIEKEWTKLNIQNPKLKSIVIDYANNLHYLWGLDVVLTGIYRTAEEQLKIYPNQPNKLSPHQFWRGVDVRDNLELWQEEAIKLIINYKYIYDIKRLKYKTLLFHDVGLSSHGHIQNII